MEQRLESETALKMQLEEKLSEKQQENESSVLSLQSQLAETEQKLESETALKTQLEETLSEKQQENESSVQSLQSQLTETEQKLESETALKTQLEETNPCEGNRDSIPEIDSSDDDLNTVPIQGSDLRTGTTAQ